MAESTRSIVGAPASGDRIGWRGIARSTPVYACGGERAGVVQELLGSEIDDIFHGIVVRRDLFGRRDVAISADDITFMSHRRLDTSLTLGEINARPPHTARESFALGWVDCWFHYSSYDGTVYLLGKLPGWVKSG